MFLHASIEILQKLISRYGAHKFFDLISEQSREVLEEIRDKEIILHSVKSGWVCAYDVLSLKIFD